MPDETPKTTDPAKLKALDAALDKIKKDHGDEAVMDMSAGPQQIESIPTGAMPLDIALGIGGIPEGRIIELFGPESSGKTTLCYHMMAEVQKRGGVAAFIDIENAMDAVYAQNLGLDMNKLIVSQPDSGEQALQITEVLTQSGAVDLIVVDSVAALVPESELQGNIGDSSVGVLARLMSQACRKLAGQANRSGTTILFTNQIREKIGVMFGSPETQPGGRALKFYSSVRLDIRRIETVKEGTEAVANRVRVKVVKNKVAPPFKQAEFMIEFGKGVNNMAALIELGMEKDVGLVSKSGSFYTFTATGEKAQGMAKAVLYLKEHPEVAEEIDTKVREVFLTRLEISGEAQDEDLGEAADDQATSGGADDAETSEVAAEAEPVAA